MERKVGSPARWITGAPSGANAAKNSSARGRSSGWCPVARDAARRRRRRARRARTPAGRRRANPGTASRPGSKSRSARRWCAARRGCACGRARTRQGRSRRSRRPRRAAISSERSREPESITSTSSTPSRAQGLEQLLQVALPVLDGDDHARRSADSSAHAERRLSLRAASGRAADASAGIAGRRAPLPPRPAHQGVQVEVPALEPVGALLAGAATRARISVSAPRAPRRARPRAPPTPR